QGVFLHLARHQILLRNPQLFFFDVTIQRQDFHAVTQRGRNGIQLVGGGDEHHLRQVPVQVEVVVAERRVLRGVQHLQQRRRRIASPVSSDLVNLVKHNQ